MIKNIFWNYFIVIGIRILKVLGILIIIKWSILYINKFIIGLKEWIKKIEFINVSDVSIEKLFDFLKSNFNNFIWVLYLIILV